MLKINEKPIQFEEDLVNIYGTVYHDGVTPAFILETIYGEPYVTLSINVDNVDKEYMVVNHDINIKKYENVLDEIVDLEDMIPVGYGWVSGVAYKIKPNIVEKIIANLNNTR